MSNNPALPDNYDMHLGISGDCPFENITNELIPPLLTGKPEFKLDF